MADSKLPDDAFGRRFRDRRAAGIELASKLHEFAGRSDVVVLALPRGGVPVGFEVAEVLRAEFDVFVVRKLGTPGHRELAMGAIASGDVRVLNDDVVRWYAIPDSVIDMVAREELAELQRRERMYRADGPPIAVENRTVILVDDGLATGSTMRAAVQAVRARGPSRVVVAVPVAAPSTCRELEDLADRVICARTPEPFSAVGQWYVDFEQTTDEEVRRLLQEHAESSRAKSRS
jgi:putative phosphoribosyl transferase